MSKDYKYTIEGEKLTLDEVRARIPEIKPETVKKRIEAGHRTWEALKMDPKLSALAYRRRKSGYIKDLAK